MLPFSSSIAAAAVTVVPRQGQPHYITLTIPRASYTASTIILLSTQTTEDHQEAVTIPPTSPTAATTAAPSAASSVSNGPNNVQTALIILSVLFAVFSAALFWCLCYRKKKRPVKPHRLARDGQNGRDGRDGL